MSLHSAPMYGGPTERDDLLRQQIKAMPPDQFEQLVFELAHREDPRVRRLVHPDGGADTLLPEDEVADTAAVVWQAKRYRVNINWGECEKSLASSIERFHPSRIIFCFPRDFSQQLEESHQSRLVKPGRDAGAEVEVWTGSELVRRLNEHEDLRVRFFGKDQEDVLTALTRTIKAGGQLENPGDLVERAKTLSEYAESRDREFTYDIASSSREAPSVAAWEQIPYMTIDAMDERSKVRVTVWEREGSGVQEPTFTFNDDDEGRDARLEAVGRWARGEEAVITRGYTIAFSAPKAMRELVPDPTQMLTGSRLRMAPPEPLPATLEIETEQGTVDYELEMRPVPLPAGSHWCAGGLDR